MRDWKGNKIKVGDTVLIYRFLKTIPVSESVASFEAQYETEIEKPTSQYVWELSEMYEILPETNFTVYICNSSENAISIDYINSIITKRNNHAVCIKGKSDNRVDFMTHYFTI